MDIKELIVSTLQLIEVYREELSDELVEQVLGDIRAVINDTFPEKIPLSKGLAITYDLTANFLANFMDTCVGNDYSNEEKTKKCLKFVEMFLYANANVLLTAIKEYVYERTIQSMRGGSPT